MPRILAALVVWLVVLGGPVRAHAAPAADFAPVPGSQLGLRILRYAGSTHGTLTVEVHNPTTEALTFAPAGLYFVPQGHPDAAPQRLGAVGEPFDVEAGATVELDLAVYCIDRHRRSPSSTTGFAVARTRMPALLSRAINLGTRRLGSAADIQAMVWRLRDARWIVLDGEGVQEATRARTRR